MNLTSRVLTKKPFVKKPSHAVVFTLLAFFNFSPSANAHLETQNFKTFRAHWVNSAVFSDTFQKMRPEGSIHLRARNLGKWDIEGGYGRTVRNFTNGDRFRDSWGSGEVGYHIDPMFRVFGRYRRAPDSLFLPKNKTDFGSAVHFQDKTILELRHGFLNYRTLKGTRFGFNISRPFDELSDGIRYGLGWQTVLASREGDYYRGNAINEANGMVGYQFNDRVDLSLRLTFGRAFEDEFRLNGFQSSDVRLSWALSPLVRLNLGTSMYRSNYRDEERWTAELDLFY